MDVVCIFGLEIKHESLSPRMTNDMTNELYNISAPSEEHQTLERNMGQAGLRIPLYSE